MGQDFFLVRFLNEEDYHAALLGGPRMIGDHYLSVREWQPNFHPEEASIDKIIAWVRIPGLPIEYYHSIFYNKLGNRLGKLIGVDELTENATREKFARLGVELDLLKPLISIFKIISKYWHIEYEGLHLVCFNCGLYGHRVEECKQGRNGEVQAIPSHEMKKRPDGVRNNADVVEDLPIQAEVLYNSGPWKLVNKPLRGK